MPIVSLMKNNFIKARFLVSLARFFLLSSFLFSPLNAADKHDDVSARVSLQASIHEPGMFSTAFWYLSSKTFNAFSSMTPDPIKNLIDNIGSMAFSFALRRDFLRLHALRSAFADDNKLFGQYDDVFGVYKEIPNEPVSYTQIKKLIEAAEKERDVWKDGKMSGAIYDGSESHMGALGEHFAMSLGLDPDLGALFEKNAEAKNIAVHAFTKFNTANPLHGTAFPLAVKAMREIGSILASLVGGEYAIANSQEALRIGISALKKRAPKYNWRTTKALVIDNSDTLSKICDTLNIETVRDTKDSEVYSDPNIDFIVLNIDETDDSDFFDSAISLSLAHQKDIHIHISHRLFSKLLLGADNLNLNNIFRRSWHIASVSFETNGVIYGDISATVFASRERRRDALEAHLDWIGGIYPGVNSAGSIAGVDYIIAYLLVLHLGKSGLSELAEQNLARKRAAATTVYSKELQNSLIEHFQNNKKLGDIHEQLKTQKNHLGDDFRDFAEQLLLGVSLSAFNADTSLFSGRITSGGTESIRVAMQVYLDLFRKRSHKIPKILMTNMAHIAFDRHLKDNDVEIIRVNTNYSYMMDTSHLRFLIDKYGNSIAAIVSSTPAYPYGVSDDIREIAKIAQENNIPLHVDSCLGAYMMQFIPDNPYKLDFSTKEFAGVTSFSGDLHKYALTQKGLSLVGIRASLLSENKLIPQTICQARSVPNLITGLLGVLTIGKHGYEERAQQILHAASQFTIKLKEFDEIEIIGRPYDKNMPYWVVGFRLKNIKNLSEERTYTLRYLMSKLGWFINQIGNYSLHMAITSAHAQNADFQTKFIKDLRFVLDLMDEYPNLQGGASAGIYGTASQLPLINIGGKEIKRKFLEAAVKGYAENVVNTPDK